MKASAVLILLILISGCTGTRSLPYTVIPPEGIKVQSEAVSRKWYSEGCSKTGTTIKSAHHEGVAQAEQYWIFGMSASQKKSMHNSSLVLAEHGFFNEFYRSGIAVLQADPGRIPEDADYFLTCSISSIIIKTYGSGFGGFGSAGNYWEAYLTFDNLSLTGIRRSSVRHFEPVTSYAKVKESPVNLGGLLAGLSFMTKTITNPFSAAASINYNYDPDKTSPVEYAGMLAADELLRKISAAE